MIAREAVPAFSIRLTTRRTKQFVAEETLKAWNYAELREELHGSRVTKEPGNRQSQEGFPSDITLQRQPPEISRKHTETERSVTIFLNCSDWTKCIFLLNWLIDLYAEKTAKSLLWSPSCKSYKIGKSASLNFLLTSKLLVCVCVCVSVCLCFVYVFYKV